MATLWMDTLLGINVASGFATLNGLTEEFSSQETRLIQATLLRTIVRLDIAATVRDSGEGDNILDLGIGVASRDAMTAVAVPDPNVQNDFPPRGWIWRSRYRVYAVAVDDQNVDVIRVDLDLRSRRKLDNGQVFLATVSTANQGVATAIQVTGLIRCLYLIS